MPREPTETPIPPRDRHADDLRRRADAITARILYSDEPRVDVDIAIGALREEVARCFPDSLWLFEILYEARWRRLREQGWERPREVL